MGRAGIRKNRARTASAARVWHDDGPPPLLGGGRRRRSGTGIRWTLFCLGAIEGGALGFALSSTIPAPTWIHVLAAVLLTVVGAVIGELVGIELEWRRRTQ